MNTSNFVEKDWCRVCCKIVTNKTTQYSLKKYKKILCFDCQKKYNKKDQHTNWFLSLTKY